jgi:hypothetical protein
MGRQMRQETDQVPASEFRWMAVAVKPDIAFDPVYVSLLGAKAVVLEANPLADLIEKARTGADTLRSRA